MHCHAYLYTLLEMLYLHGAAASIWAWWERPHPAIPLNPHSGIMMGHRGSTEKIKMRATITV